MHAMGISIDFLKNRLLDIEGRIVPCHPIALEKKN